MDKFWYKDELFYYKIKYSKEYDTIKSYLTIGILREGFWKYFSKYKTLVSIEFGKMNYKNDEEVLMWYARRLDTVIIKKKPIMIDCSKEITNLFSDD